jgi:hypothetical protein
MLLNTLQTGDANLCFLRYNCERQMMQNCILTCAWFLRNLITQYMERTKNGPVGRI